MGRVDGNPLSERFVIPDRQTDVFFASGRYRMRCQQFGCHGSPFLRMIFLAARNIMEQGGALAQGDPAGDKGVCAAGASAFDHHEHADIECHPYGMFQPMAEIIVQVSGHLPPE